MDTDHEGTVLGAAIIDVVNWAIQVDPPRRWAPRSLAWHVCGHGPPPCGQRPQRHLSAVQRLYVGAECLQDDVALHLQGRRELSGFLREVDGQHPYLLDRLSGRHRLVRVVHCRLEGGQQVGVLVEVGHAGSLRLAGLHLPRPERLRVNGDQGADERPPVADHDALADQPVGPQPVLEHHRGHVLTRGGDQDVLLAAGDREVAVVVELAQVTAVEPAVLVEDLARRLVVVPVALEDVATLDQYFVVVGDANRASGDRASYRADALRGGQVEGHSCTCLLYTSPSPRDRTRSR